MNDYGYGPEELKDKAEKVHDLAMEATFDCLMLGDPIVFSRDAYSHATKDFCSLELENGTTLPSGELSSEHREVVSAYYRQFTDRVAKRVKPYPREIGGIVTQVAELSRTLGSIELSVDNGDKVVQVGGLNDGELMSEVSDAKNQLVEWKGAFSENLHEYLTRLETVGGNVLFVLDVLKKATEAIQSVNKAKRRSLSSIVDKAISALNELKNTTDFWEGLPGNKELKPGLFVVGAAVTLTAAATGAAPVAFAAASITIAAASEDFSKKAGHDFMSASPVHVVEKMGRAITELHQDYEKELRKIAKNLRTNTGLIWDEAQRFSRDEPYNAFVLAAPEIVGASNQEIYSSLFTTK